MLRLMRAGLVKDAPVNESRVFPVKGIRAVNARSSPDYTLAKLTSTGETGLKRKMQLNIGFTD